MTRLPFSLSDIVTEMIPPDSNLLPARKSDSEETEYDITRAASTLILLLSDLDSPSSLFLRPLYPDTSPPTMINRPNFAPVSAQNHFLAFDTSDLHDPRFAFNPLGPTEGPVQFPWLSSGPVLEYDPSPAYTEVPGINNDPFSWSSMPGISFDHLPIPHAADPDLQTPYSGTDMEEYIQNPAISDPFVIDIPPLSPGRGQQETGFPPMNQCTPDFENSAVWSDVQSYMAENSHVPVIVPEPEATQCPYYPAIPTLEQQVLPSGEPVGYCRWKDEAVECGEPITRDTLPGHLAKHNIKNLTRNHRIKCNWAGCKTKKFLNRESIVRHIREVHLRLKRPSKRMQDCWAPDSCSNSG